MRRWMTIDDNDVAWELERMTKWDRGWATTVTWLRVSLKPTTDVPSLLRLVQGNIDINHDFEYFKKSIHEPYAGYVVFCF